MKGRSHLLLRIPKISSSKKRNMPLYKDEEIKHEESDEDVNSLKEEIERLNTKLTQKEKESQESQKYADLLSDLYEKGIIDADGNFINENQEY